MNDARWEQVKTLLAEKFEILAHEEGQEEDGPGQFERFVFRGPAGMMKMERITRPKLIERRAIASRRIGSSATEQAVYSEEETVSFLRCFLQKPSGWEEIKADAFWNS